MDNEPKDSSINRLAWSVLIVAVVLLAAVFAWKWYSHRAETPSTETASGTPADASQPAPVVINLNTPPPPMVVSTPPAPMTPHKVIPPSHILQHDPGVFERQTEALMKQSAASEVSTVGPSKLALTPEQIKAIADQRLILQ
jgi:hypothetical protein